jgi:hypothetical protein
LLKHLTEKKSKFFSIAKFFSVVQVTAHIWKQCEELFKNTRSKNYSSLRICTRIRIWIYTRIRKIFCRSEAESKKIFQVHNTGANDSKWILEFSTFFLINVKIWYGDTLLTYEIFLLNFPFKKLNGPGTMVWNLWRVIIKILTGSMTLRKMSQRFLRKLFQ